MADQQKYTGKLANKRCLVIGGTSGIGFAVAESLVELGAKVMVSSSNPERVEKTIQRLQTAYPSKKNNVTGKACDLGDEEKLESNVKELLESATEGNTKKLDHVVHTAGDSLRSRLGGLESMDMKSIRAMATVRFFSCMMLGKLAPSYMNPGPASSVTLTTGTVSQKPIPGWALGGAFASGLHGLTRGLALDLKPLRFNLISPGAVMTELWEKSLPQEQIEMFMNEFVKEMPTGQIGKPEDVAEAYLYVIKDINTTGSIVSTNGGSLLS